jgi:hypothetical protein
MSGAEAIAYGGRIFQSIAAGFLGRASFQDGMRAALLGLAVHFFVAFSIVATHYVAVQYVPILVRRPFVCGAVYGVLVYVFMDRVIISLSAIGTPAFSWPPFINGVAIHIAGVGIPAALFVARSVPLVLSAAGHSAPHLHA